MIDIASVSVFVASNEWLTIYSNEWAWAVTSNEW